MENSAIMSKGTLGATGSKAFCILNEGMRPCVCGSGGVCNVALGRCAQTESTPMNRQKPQRLPAPLVLLSQTPTQLSLEPLRALFGLVWQCVVLYASHVQRVEGVDEIQ